MSYGNAKRKSGTKNGYPKMFFIEGNDVVYGPWYINPKSEWRNRVKHGQDVHITKFEYNNELGVYQKEYLDIQLTEKDLAK